MSFDKEKENGTINNNYYNHSLHQMFNASGGTPYNTSPASSPSVAGNYPPLSMYGTTPVTSGGGANSGNTTSRYPINLQQQTQLMNAVGVGGSGSQTPTTSESTAAATVVAGTPYLAKQLTYAQISRQSSSPHHHARAAAAMARNTPISSTVTITDPNDPNKSFNGSLTATTATTTTTTNIISGGQRGTSEKKEKEEEEQNCWTSLDMGGMGLKNIAPTICNYHFLTALYINHNNLTFLMPALSLLSNLTILDASGNKLSMLPSELGLLHNLRELFLFDNHLVSIPIEFGNLYQLETLGLEGNPLQSDLKNILVKDGTQALIMSLRENAPVGMPPPHREWLLVEGDTMEDPDKFTVLCHNILCQKYATAQVYGYTPSWALNWDYRRELIISDILAYNADIICLQEMEMGQYEDYFKDHFKKMGDWESVFHPKTRAKTMSEKERRLVDGCATFYKTTRFRLLDHQFIEYNQKALQRPDFKQTVDVYNRVMNKDNIAVIVLLQDINNPINHVVIANSHIHWDTSDSDVKLVQVGILMEELKHFSTKHNMSNVSTLVCGDYNSSPDSGVYEFFSKGIIQQDHDDFGNYSYGKYTTEGVTHNLSLKSSYHSIGELPFTNYTPGFKGTLDYIWYTTNNLDIISLLGPIDSDYLKKVVGFPNAHFPSDHIPIMAELKFKTSNRKENVKADFGNTRNNNRSK